MKSTMILMATVLVMGFSAQASEMITCHSEEYPEGMGSQLTVTLQDGKVSDVQMVLNEKDPVGLKTQGFFHPHFAVNENHTEVVYLSWYAGAYSDAELNKLIPNKMVFYAFDHFLERKQISVGFIKHGSNGKTETYKRYICP